MSRREPAATRRPPRSTILGGLVVICALLGGVAGLVRAGIIGLGEADGAVPDTLTVFDRERPAVIHLDTDLLGALRRAATDAARDRVEILVSSGWRSARYQERLFREAVSKYGSAKAAARWVATANTSSHVSGDAVDITPSRAMEWLSRHGARYGLCQIYKNEPWHFELRPQALHRRCPSMYASPVDDPRMKS